MPSAVCHHHANLASVLAAPYEGVPVMPGDVVHMPNVSDMDAVVSAVEDNVDLCSRQLYSAMTSLLGGSVNCTPNWQ